MKYQTFGEAGIDSERGGADTSVTHCKRLATVMNTLDSAASSLFHGLSEAELDDVCSRMQRKHYAGDQHLCRHRDPGDRLFIIESGLVEIVIDDGHRPIVVGRFRQGDIVGEMALVTGEPRAASVVAIVPTVVLELDQAGFANVVARYPQILANISRVLAHRYKHNTLRQLEQPNTSEVMALMFSHGTERIVEKIIAAVGAASPRKLMVVDLSAALGVEQIPLPESTVESALTMLDNLVARRGTILIAAYSNRSDLAPLIKYMDRIAVVGNKRDAREIGARLDGAKCSVDLFVTEEECTGMRPSTSGMASTMWSVRRARSDKDIGWIGRHLARTKIGLALGAGGAKGFAHVGALRALEVAGFVVDYVAGSSIGANVGTLMALGLGAREIDDRLRRMWSPDHVELLTSLSPDGFSLGLQRVLDVLTDIHGNRDIADLEMPLTIMTADLEAKEPVPLRQWPLSNALRAALSIPGLAPPYKHESRRLVDGICLVPVPAGAVREAGADIVISINILGRDTLRAWPGNVPDRPTPKQKQAGNLSPVVETLMMLQMDTSARNAELGDIVLTPCFAPASWRDFHLADLFLQAGRQAAEEQLLRLLELARPTVPVMASCG